MTDCSICNKQLSSISNLSKHIRCHNISSKEYYDLFIKKETEGICSCGEPTKFHSIVKGYATYCSMKCVANSRSVRNKKIKTCIDKYGVSNPSQSQHIKNKISENRWKTKSEDELHDIQNKCKETFLMNYGVDNPLKNIRIKNKAIKSRWKTKSKNELCDIRNKMNTTRIKNKNPIIESRLAQLNLKLINDFVGVTIPTHLMCLKCNTEFETILDYVFHNYGLCPKCNPIQVSSFERKIRTFVTDIIGSELDIHFNNRSILNGLELDIYIPSLDIAIECDGIYFHSDKFLSDANYHLNKTLKCEEKGIHLIHIFEDEPDCLVKQKLNFLLSAAIKYTQPNYEILYLSHDEFIITAADKDSYSKVSCLIKNNYCQIKDLETVNPFFLEQIIKLIFNNTDIQEISMSVDNRWKYFYKNLDDTCDHSIQQDINFYYVKNRKRSINTQDNPDSVSTMIDLHRIWDCGTTTYFFKKLM